LKNEITDQIRTVMLKVGVEIACKPGARFDKTYNIYWAKIGPAIPGSDGHVETFAREVARVAEFKRHFDERNAH